MEDFEPGSWRPGWQHEASSRTEQQFKDMLFVARLSPSALSTVVFCLQLTPHWCVFSTPGRIARTASCCSPPPIGRNAPLLRKRVQQLGVSGGVQCCPAPLLAQSRPQCWSCPGARDADGALHDVEQDFRFAGLVEPDRAGFCHTLHCC